MYSWLKYKFKQKSKFHQKSIEFREMMEANDQYAYEKMFADDMNIKIYMDKNRLEFLKSVVELAVSKISVVSKTHILDVGCGTGDLLNILIQRKIGATHLGIDYASTAERVVKSLNGSIEFVCGDLYELTLPRKYDLVFCTEVIEHVPRPRKFVERIFQTMDSGGHLIITVPDGRKDTWTGHRNFWSPESFEEFISEFYEEYEIDYLENTNFAVVKKC
ncbi:class I SAM-dependent methyltransferase [Rhodophyticola sp. SM2404]